MGTHYKNGVSSETIFVQWLRTSALDHSSASINTASIMEKQKLDDGLGWPAFGTFAWLAVMYAILSIGMTFSNKTLAQVANNACLCCLFSGLVVAQLAPFYVGKWKEIEEPLAHQKMDICVIVFSSFSILGAWSLNLTVATVLHKKWCGACENSL